MTLPSIAGDYLSDYETISRIYQSYANSTLVNNENGYFREYGYGLVSIYKCDIMNSKVNGFVTGIKGWGLEDVMFLEKILTANHQVQNQLLISIADGTEANESLPSNYNFDAFRVPDDSLVHIFHHVLCDKNLEKNQLKMCLGTKSGTLGNYRLLKEKYFLQKDFMKFIKEVVIN